MITEEITSMTEGQRKQIARFLQDALKAFNTDAETFLDSLKLSKEGAQEIIEKGNLLPEQITKALSDVLKQNSIVDKRFGEAIRTFEITVPANYTHDTQIDTFRTKVKKEKTTYYYNDDLNSKNFAKATNKIEPGKKYTVKIFPILESVDSESCMAFLKKQNAILVGGQGATLAYELAKDQFPKDKWTASFDEKNSLWEDADGDHRVPSVYAHSDGDFKFSLGRFESGWDSDVCLLCFCDK